MPKNVKIRPLTIVLVLVAVGLVGLGVVYFTTTAGRLPPLMPGHEAGSARHHIKHGLAMIGLAVIALIGAWFTTSPDQ